MTQAQHLLANLRRGSAVHIHRKISKFSAGWRVRQGCRNGVQRSALGSHPNMAVVFEHGSADMARNAHDGLVGSLRFRQLGYGAMPQVVESQTGKRAFDSLDFMCTLRILAGIRGRL